MSSVTSSRFSVSPLSANRQLRQADQTEPLDVTPKTVCGKVPVPEGGPREMTKSDIANVEFISASDLDSVFDSLIEATSFQHCLEDCECSWNIADVDTELMDLRDPPKPFKSAAAWAEVLPFRAKRR